MNRIVVNDWNSKSLYLRDRNHFPSKFSHSVLICTATESRPNQVCISEISTENDQKVIVKIHVLAISVHFRPPFLLPLNSRLRQCTERSWSCKGDKKTKATTRTTPTELQESGTKVIHKSEPILSFFGENVTNISEKNMDGVGNEKKDR